MGLGGGFGGLIGWGDDADLDFANDLPPPAIVVSTTYPISYNITGSENSWKLPNCDLDSRNFKFLLNARKQDPAMGDPAERPY